jgi:hypothetical protein
MFAFLSFSGFLPFRPDSVARSRVLSPRFS